MNLPCLNLRILTDTAITALKNAYEECSDSKGKESIFNAANAVIVVHQNLGKCASRESLPECDGDCDPSEYCAAV